MKANELVTFNFGPCAVHAITKEGSPWFLAKDVCSALALGNPSQALRGLDSKQKGIIINDTLGGNQKMLCVNESGLYALIFKSRKKEAVQFQRWVTEEVLPTLRQTGSYAVSNVATMSATDLIAALEKKIWDPAIEAGILKRMFPKTQRGALGKNGKVRNIFVRSAWREGPDHGGFALELAKLETQMQMIELLQEVRHQRLTA